MDDDLCLVAHHGDTVGDLEIEIHAEVAAIDLGHGRQTDAPRIGQGSRSMPV